MEYLANCIYISFYMKTCHSHLATEQHIPVHPYKAPYPLEIFLYLIYNFYWLLFGIFRDFFSYRKTALNISRHVAFSSIYCVPPWDPFRESSPSLFDRTWDLNIEAGLCLFKFSLCLLLMLDKFEDRLHQFLSSRRIRVDRKYNRDNEREEAVFE